jgi:hypothetical protein
MSTRVLTAVAAAAIGLSAMTGTAAAAEDVEACRKLNAYSHVCVRVLEGDSLVGVTYCNGFFCMHRDVIVPR